MVLTEQRTGALLHLTINRPEERNAINQQLQAELCTALSRADADTTVRMVALHGQPGVFSTGTDFSNSEGAADPEESARGYFRLLRAITESPKIVASVVEGEAMAGGVGLLAACDHVICTSASTFRLPEILLGLIPACVIPFLARRVGTHRAFHLALTARNLSAVEALDLGLVDEIADSPRDALRRFALCIDRAPLETAARLKRYMNELEAMPTDFEDRAVNCIAPLLSDPENALRVEALMRHGLWQRTKR
jgi:polyketide biosynthesis enoyl-CoA hydratase PksH